MYCDDMPGRSIRFPLNGEQLAHQREEAGLSQKALADAMGAAGVQEVSRGAVANWETERTKPLPASFKVLVDVLAQIHEVGRDEMRARLQDEQVAA